MQQNNLHINIDALGRSIASRRASFGYTQEYVAEHLGIGVEAVSRIERGVVLPNLLRLAELAELFQCQISELICDSSTRPSDQVSRLSRMLETLGMADRALIISLVEQLVSHLQASASPEGHNSPATNQKHHLHNGDASDFMAGEPL